ncbi:MAG: hypothetical protein ACK4M1_07065 [Flavobacterium sp.]
MAYKIIVSPIAIKNIDNAVNYYIEEVSKKVALDFLNDYKKTYKDLQKTLFILFMIVITGICLLKNFLLSLSF